MNTELRIGNFIFRGKNNKPDDEYPLGFWHKVRSIGNEDQEFEQIECEAEESFEWVFKDNWEGIPLCENWLFALGFEKTEDLGDMIYYELKGSGTRRYTICNNHDEWEFSLTVRDEYITLIYDEPFFQCVHHLQNLWYSLTGKELEFNGAVAFKN